MKSNLGRGGLPAILAAVLLVPAHAGAGSLDITRQIPVLAESASGIAGAAGVKPVVGSVKAPASVRFGTPFTATVTVVNRGRRRTDRTQVNVVLSRDARRDARDARVTTLKVPELKRRASRRFRVQVNAEQPGARRLLACIGKRCRGPVVSVKAAPAGLPPAPAQVPTPAPTSALPAPLPTPTPTAGVDPAEPPPRGDPLDVVPSLDAGHAASALIRAQAGGEITAVGADGATFRLVIPADGLLSDERITLTPVGGIAGSPFTAASTAVDITPHGLQLAELATLTVTPPAAIPPEQQFVFVTREAGKDFHAYPPTLATDTIEMKLSHFSVAGVGSATAAERDSVATRTPADAQAQLEKLVGERMQEMKRGGTFDGDALAPYLLDYYERVVKPRLQSATTDDTLAVLAMSSYLGWERQVQLVAVEAGLTDQMSEGLALMGKVMQFALDQGFERCMNQETAYATALVALGRMIVVAGGPEALGHEALERYSRCARFELDFDARVEKHSQDNLSNGSPEEHYEIAVQAHDIPLVTDLDDLGRFVTTGTQALVVGEWTYSSTASYAGDWAAGKVEHVAPLSIEARIPLSSRIETASDGRTRYVLNRGRPEVELNPGRLKLYITKGSNYQHPVLLFEYQGEFARIWAPERLAFVPGVFRFGAFFDESLPKLGLFLEDRSQHTDQNDLVVDRFGRLRMELEHAPKR